MQYINCYVNDYYIISDYYIIVIISCKNGKTNAYFIRVILMFAHFIKIEVKFFTLMHYGKKEKKQKRKHSSQVNFNISLLPLRWKIQRSKGLKEKLKDLLEK